MSVANYNSGPTLSLLGESHQNHDPKWTLSGVRPQSVLCIACIVEKFESSEELLVTKQFFLGELLGLLTSSARNTIWELLADSEEVLELLLRTVFNVLQLLDEEPSNVACEILVLLCIQLKSDDLVYLLIQEIIAKVEAGCSYPRCLPYLTLIGQLLQAVPALALSLTQHGESLLEYLVAGLSYQSDAVRTSIAYVLARLVPALPASDISCQLGVQIAAGILPVIAAAQSQLLQANTIGLMRRLLESKELVAVIMKPGNQPSFSSVVKKILMSRKDVLQISCVQCLSQVIVQDGGQAGGQGVSHTERLLDEDVAEFLYEALSTTNDLLLSSIFCCLLLLCKHETFFTRCHTVYGIEAIVRALQHCQKLSTTETLTQGLQLLSEILHRQPEDLKLLTSLSICRHICDLLAHCIRHQESRVSAEAMQAFCHLLRRDHLPSPVDFTSLSRPMDATLAALSRLPRPMAKPQGCGRLPHRSRRTRGSGGGSSRREEQTAAVVAASQQHQYALYHVLVTMLQGLKLCLACGEDPAADPSLFLRPQPADGPTLHSALQPCDGSLAEDSPPSENSLSSFTTYLLGCLDSVCIPTVMVNHDVLSQPGIYTALFECLSLMLTLQPDKGSTGLPEKLVGSSFVQIAFEVRHKYQSAKGVDQLKEASGAFLVDILRILSPDEQSSDLMDSFTEVAGNITGPPEELCHLLEHRETLLGRSSAQCQATHQFLLALLYYTRLYGDRWIPDETLLMCLSSFISHHPEISSLTSSAVKHLLFLYADSFVQSANHAPTNACGILADLIIARNMTAVYTNHRSILHWAFTAPRISQEAMAAILFEWLHYLPVAMELDDDEEEEQEEDISEVAFTVHLMSRCDACLDLMLDALVQSAAPTVMKCAALLRRLLSQVGGADDDSSVGKVRRRVPDILQNFLLLPADSQSRTGAALQHVMQVVSTLYQNHLPCQLDEADLKVIYHVINILTKQAGDTDDVKLPCLTCLTALLQQSARHGEARVLSVILSNETLLKSIQHDANLAASQLTSPLQVRLQCVSLRLLAHITLQQKQHRLKVHYTGHLREAHLLDMVSCSSNENLQLASLELWTALFVSHRPPHHGSQPSSSAPAPAPAPAPAAAAPGGSSSKQPPVIRLHAGGRRKLLEEGDVGLPVSAYTLRKLYALLQNSVMQGNTMLLEPAVACMKAMVGMTANLNPKTCHHLLSQPWNQLLVNCGVEIYQEACLTYHPLLQIITMFLKQGNSQGYVLQQHVDVLLDTIFKTEPSQYEDRQELSVQEFMDAVTSRPELSLSQRQIEQISSWRDKLQSHLKQLC